MLKIITFEEMEKEELRAIQSVCLVLTEIEFLHLSTQMFLQALIANLKKNIEYRFIIPDDPDTVRYFEDFKKRVLAMVPELSAELKYVAANQRAIGLFSSMALIDPHLAAGRGFLRHFDESGYCWLKMDRLRLEKAFSGFEYFWITQPITGRFFPSTEDPLVPRLVISDYQEALNCKMLSQNRAAITLFARVLEGILLLYAKKHSIEIPKGLGLGQLLSFFKKIPLPFSRKQLDIFGFMINQYRIENVHIQDQDQRPDNNDVQLVWSALHKVLASMPADLEIAPE